MSEYDTRALLTLGVVQLVDDTGEVQTAQVQTHDGVTRAAVEVLQPFGLATRPPGDGATAVLLAIGGDAANQVALPLGCPGVRFGGLEAGESVLYGADGSRVAIRSGGVVEIHAASTVIVACPTVEITGNVSIAGTLTVAGDIFDENGTHGSVGALRTAYDDHVHGDVQNGGGTTAPPNLTL